MALRLFDVRLATAVRKAQVPHTVVLRDYALSYVLAGIYNVSELRDGMAFKGGTVLRKCYFREYRFSEDLDFTLIRDLNEERVGALLSEAAAHAAALSASSGPFRYTVERVEHNYEHPFGQLDFRVHVDFPTGANLAIKVEVTRDEPVLRPIKVLPLIHDFEGESLTPQISCYSLEEIAVEKIRAFLQARRHLRTKNWVNRTRDLFDLWYLHRQSGFPIEWSSLMPDLRKKASARNEEFAAPDDFRDRRVLDVYRTQWRLRLQNFVVNLPPFTEAAVEFDRILEEVFSKSA